MNEMDASATNQSVNDASVVAALAERVRQFAETKNPELLWPGLVEQDRVAAARELERVTSVVLSGAPTVVLDAQHKHSPYAIAVAAHTTGMGPQLGRWAESGRLLASAAHTHKLAEHLAHARRRHARMSSGALTAIDSLLALGVVPLALKGLHTSRVFFQEPAVRRMSDIDLFVHPHQLRDTERALASSGFTQFGPALPHKKEWIAAGVSHHAHSLELSDELSRWTIEIHTSLDSVFYRGVVAHLDPLSRHTQSFDIEGRSIRALEKESLLIHTACHCSELDANRLLRVFELALIARTGVDWDRLMYMLKQTGTARFTWPALSLVESLAPETVDRRVLERGRKESTWAARHTVKRLAPAGGRIGDVGLLRQLMWARGGTALLQRAGRLAWPKSEGAPGPRVSGWRVRLAQLRRGSLSLAAPDERAPR